MGESIGLKAFYAAIIGGFNQTRGALLGAFLVGVLENLTGAYISPAYKEGVALLLFLVVIIFRPEGLLARPRSAKYEQRPKDRTAGPARSLRDPPLFLKNYGIT